MPKTKKQIQKNFNTLERLEITYVPIETIRPNDYNANFQNDHEFNLLIASISEDGFSQPIVALRDSNVIVDGEHRWHAAKHLGMEEIPVVYTDMTVEQARIATLRHNRARGNEDLQLAAEVLRDLERLGALPHAQDSLGLSDVEVQHILEDIPASEMFAGEEYSESWDIASGRQLLTGDGDTLRSTREDFESMDTPTTQTATPGALKKQHSYEQRRQAARSAEERAQVRKEASEFWRLSVLLEGEDAVRVKAALGDEPPKTLLALIDHGLRTGFFFPNQVPVRGQEGTDAGVNEGTDEGIE